jgi:hypothetical protein
MQRFILLFPVCSCLLFTACAHESSPSAPLSLQASGAPVSPPFPGAAAFVDGLSNPYLAFTPGRVFRYQGDTKTGVETVVVEVTHQKKTILGVATTVVHDQGYVDGVLNEDTFDWYAEDTDGNVWYFGEDSKQIVDGQVVSTEGSWEGGVNGATPGIAMLAHPAVGVTYQQEFAAGVAEDMAKVVSLTEKVQVPFGGFTGCLETAEWTHIEPAPREYKYYQPGIGELLEVSHQNGGERLELVSID